MDWSLAIGLMYSVYLVVYFRSDSRIRESRKGATMKVIEAPPEMLKGRLNQPRMTHAEAQAQLRRSRKNQPLSKGVGPIFAELKRMEKIRKSSN